MTHLQVNLRKVAVRDLFAIDRHSGRNPGAVECPRLANWAQTRSVGRWDCNEGRRFLHQRNQAKRKDGDQSNGQHKEYPRHTSLLLWLAKVDLGISVVSRWSL